jgi:hypothetical protein
VPQGNSLCSYLKQTKISFLFSFFCKIGEQKGGTGPEGGGERMIPVGGRRRWREGVRG